MSLSKSADHVAVARANAALDPDNEKDLGRVTGLESTLAALFHDGHLHSMWDMLQGIYPELKVSGKPPCVQAWR